MEEALEILDEIENNIAICCAVTMEPDDVYKLLDKLRIIIKNTRKIN
jgi:hypothetical protein